MRDVINQTEKTFVPADALKASVIVCARNPRTDYLTRVISALQSQTLIPDRWELLIIDNGSRNRLQSGHDISWHPNGRHIREEEVGLTAARLRGIKEARGQTLVFVDDDSVLAPDYLETALHIRTAYPYLSVFGTGEIEPEFEAPPPPGVPELFEVLGLRTVKEPRWSNHFNDWETIPWGAGLSVDRVTAAEYWDFVVNFYGREFISGRGDHLFRGGDDLFSFIASRSGKGFGIFPALRVLHLIPAAKLRHSYICRLLHDKTISNTILKYRLLGQKEATHTWTRCRTLLRGFIRGWPSMRRRWAVEKGRAVAMKLVEQRSLKPLNLPLHQFSCHSCGVASIGNSNGSNDRGVAQS
jgi:glycosyltransferase involved in cell wall biosynthesis